MTTNITTIILFSAAASMANIQAEGAETSTRGIETIDGSNYINVVATTTDNKGHMTISGRVFGSKSSFEDEYSAATRSLESAISELERRVNTATDPTELRLTKAMLHQSRSLLDGVKGDRGAILKPAYSKLICIYVLGENLSASTWHTAPYPASSAVIDLPKGNRQTKAVMEYSVVCPKSLRPGKYTLFLTPLDLVSLEGNAILGGTDTLNIEVK